MRYENGPGSPFFFSLALGVKELTHLIVNFGFYNKSHSLRVFPEKASPLSSKVASSFKHILSIYTVPSTKI